jgi:hypothetical protein
MGRGGIPAQDTDLMDIDIDMGVDDNGPAMDEEFQLEVNQISHGLMIVFSHFTGGRRAIFCSHGSTGYGLIRHHSRNLHRRSCS